MMNKRTKRALEGKDTNLFYGNLQVPTEDIDKVKRRKTTKTPLSIRKSFCFPANFLSNKLMKQHRQLSPTILLLQKMKWRLQR
jgi:hypothetical protein